MALEQKLRLKLAQRLVMTPSLQQAIKLLQLSRIELEETLAQEILENPMLEVEEQGQEEPAQGEGIEAPSQGDTTPTPAETAREESPLPSPEETYADIDVDAFFSDYLGDARSEGPSMAYSDTADTPLENVVSAPEGLFGHLMWQLHMLSCPEELTNICEFIVGNLDEDGFLHASDDEILAATGADEATLQRALITVRSLDPPGIGARTLQECLAFQVDLLLATADPEERTVLDRTRALVCEYWDDFLHQRWEKIATALHVDLGELRPALDVIQRLERKPGRQYHRDTNTYIEPDVYVRKVDGEYVISLNDDGLPRLRVNSQYARLLEGSVLDSEAASYLKDKMRSAVWLMKSIDQRQRTIYKVARSIVSFQRDFLDRGIELLKPMVLRQVAEDIGMHESTISRVVSNKYMYTPRGLFPMRFFFHSGVDSARGENVSSLVVKERIRKLVESEDLEHPLSDSKIMKLLQREGIRLARRTVAKYREELAIPSSEKRKRVF